MTDILIGLVPAVAWGAQNIVMQLIGGRYTNKNMGMAFGVLIFAIGVFIFHRPAEVTSSLIWGSILCGISWSLGNILQVKSFDMIGL